MAKRANGENTIFKRNRKRADGSKYVMWCAEYISADGQRKTLYAKTQSDVKEKLRNALEERDTQLLTLHTNTTVKQYIEQYLLTKRDVSKGTMAVMRLYFRDYIIAHIGHIEMQRLDLRDCERMFSTLIDSGSVKSNGGLAPSVLKKVKSLLSGVLNKAIDEELLPPGANFLNKIKLPRIQKTKINPLTQDEIKQILKTAQGTIMYVPFLLAIATGLRRGELLGLCWSDIDFASGSATIQRQLVVEDGQPVLKDNLKTDNSNRVIGIPEKVLSALKLWQQEQQGRQIRYQDEGLDYFQSDYVVTQENGKYYHPRNFAEHLERLFKQAGIERRSVHTMRHSFATQLLTAGVYVNEVQFALGHKDVSTTLSKYGHLLPGRQKEIASKMNELI